MSPVLRCPQGHEWELPEGESVEPASAVCPVCGQSTLSTKGPQTRGNGAHDTGEGPPLLEAYEVLEEVGRGGMGVVYKARHRERNRIVALKIIRTDRLGHPEAVARFRREARAAARLSHPNIVLLFESDQEGDIHYLAMEYVPGITLQEFVEQRGALPVAVACDYIRQAALGLQHAREQKLIHRDIKPANLMITPLASGGREPPAQADSGGSRPPLASGIVLGTPDYIAPEQLEDPHSADIRADLYSLGCTFYFLLSGRVPFPGGTLIQKLERQLRSQEFSREVAAVAASGNNVVVGSGVGLRLRDRMGQELHRYTGHLDAVRSVAVTTDGSVLASGGDDRTVRLWDGTNGRPMQRLTGQTTAVTGVAFSPDGSLLATGCTDGTIFLWSVTGV